MKFRMIAAFAALAGMATAVPGSAQQFERKLQHTVAPCQGDGPAVWIYITNIKSATGNMRVVLYRARESDWLEKGRWLQRFEVPAREGTMSVCMPVPSAGEYAIAIRHDANNNDWDDIFTDGGGMSGNPSLNIFNLGRPNVSKARFSIGNEVLPMTIRMRYV